MLLNVIVTFINFFKGTVLHFGLSYLYGKYEAAAINWLTKLGIKTGNRGKPVAQCCMKGTKSAS